MAYYNPRTAQTLLLTNQPNLVTTTIQFLLRSVAMATVVSQHVRHLGYHLKFFKTIIFSKIAANFLEFKRKHVIRDWTKGTENFVFIALKLQFV